MIAVAMGLLAAGGCGLLSSDDEGGNVGGNGRDNGRAVRDAEQSLAVPLPAPATGTTMRPPAATWPTILQPPGFNTNTTEVVSPSLRSTYPTTTTSLISSTTTTIVFPRTVAGVVDALMVNSLPPQTYTYEDWTFTGDEAIRRVTEAWQAVGVADPIDDLPDAVLRLTRGVFARCGDEFWRRDYLLDVLEEVWSEEYSWGKVPEEGLSALAERLPEELTSTGTTSAASRHITSDDYMRILTEVVGLLGEEAQIRLMLWWTYLMSADYWVWGCPQIGVDACVAEVEDRLAEGEFSAEEAASESEKCVVIVEILEKQALAAREIGAEDYCVDSFLSWIRFTPYQSWEYSTEDNYELFEECEEAVAVRED